MQELIHKLKSTLSDMQQAVIPKQYHLMSPEVQDITCASLRLTIGEVHTIVMALLVIDMQNQINQLKKQLREA